MQIDEQNNHLANNAPKKPSALILRVASHLLVSKSTAYALNFELILVNRVISDPRRGGRPPPRRDHEDKVHDPLIEERLQRERPCRTLFIRNIKVSNLNVAWSTYAHKIS